MPAASTSPTGDLLLESAPVPGRRPSSFWRFRRSGVRSGAGVASRSPVLALAGLGLDGRSFSRMGDLARDRDVLLWNLPNDLSPAPPTMADLAARALDAMEAAGHGDRPAVLLGSSFGGMVALAAALEQPSRVRALVLLGTCASWSEVPWRLRASAVLLHPWIPRRAYPRVFAAFMLPPFRDQDPEMRRVLRRQMLHRTKAGVGAMLSALRGFDVRGRLGSVEAPALVVHGEQDRVFAPSSGRALASGLPRAAFVPIPGCGHLPQVTHPEPTLSSILAVLEKEDS